MTSVRELHNKAMDFTDRAFVERNRGNSERSLEFFEKALDTELAAIAELDETRGLTWSILHRSAGTLALDCGRLRQAEQIVAKALSEEPHPEIVGELRELWEQVNSRMNLDPRVFTLQDDELQLEFAGAGVGSGIADFDDIYGRLKSLTRLIYRMVERNMRRPFRIRGPLTKAIRESFRPMVSVPRSGSYGATLKFGNRLYLNQASLPEAGAIVEEFMDLIELVNDAHIFRIQERIPDHQYLQNFFNLTREIAPDGQRIQEVTFTASHYGLERSIALTVPAVEIGTSSYDARVAAPTYANEAGWATETHGFQDTSAEVAEIRGTFRYADGMQGENSIIRIADDWQSFNILVPEQMMPRVMPMWNTQVIVQGIRTQRGVILSDIRQHN